jgi:hypothetical protein
MIFLKMLIFKNFLRTKGNKVRQDKLISSRFVGSK